MFTLLDLGPWIITFGVCIGPMFVRGTPYSGTGKNRTFRNLKTNLSGSLVSSERPSYENTTETINLNFGL